MADPHPMNVFLTGIIGTSVLSSKYRSYIEELRLSGSERVLEIGAGAGAASVHLARRLQPGGHLTILEPSPVWLARLRQKLRDFPNVNIVSGDIHEEGLPAESFDAAVSHSLFHLLPHHDRSRLIRSVTRVLTGKGRFYIREPIRKHFAARDIRKLLFDHDMEEHEYRVSGNTYDGIFIRRTFTW